MSLPATHHLADPFVKPFLAVDFDPASYLNGNLFVAKPAGYNAVGTKKGAAALAESQTQSQALTSQLNAQSSRLTAALTQLTDDILRTGGRLAYQVEVLRGETLGLSESLTEDLHTDIARLTVRNNHTAPALNVRKHDGGAENSQEPPRLSGEKSAAIPQLDQLRTLLRVRERLEQVVKTFGDAMQWVIPPSEMSLASSLISVSGPEPGTDNQSREEKGREHTEKLRRDITDLISARPEAKQGHAAAIERIETLRELAQVWKGTSEEKPRAKLIDSLVKLADESQKAAEREMDIARSKHTRNPSAKQNGTGRQDGSEKAYSILDRLYLD